MPGLSPGANVPLNSTFSNEPIPETVQPASKTIRSFERRAVANDVAVVLDVADDVAAADKVFAFGE